MPQGGEKARSVNRKSELSRFYVLSGAILPYLGGENDESLNDASQPSKPEMRIGEHPFERDAPARTAKARHVGDRRSARGKASSRTSSKPWTAARPLPEICRSAPATSREKRPSLHFTNDGDVAKGRMSKAS